MARILINGVNLNVEVTGTGPPVLAIHGFTGSAATWELFAAAACSDCTVIAVDMLGHGASDAPASAERYRMERCVEDLAELIHRLGVQRVNWLGYSMGGRIALSAAIAIPYCTSSLIVESASPGLATADERAARVRKDEKLAAWIDGVGIGPFVDYWEAQPLFASQARLPAAVRAKVRARRLANTPSGLANSLRGVGAGVQPPLHQQLHMLAAPALFIAGQEDTKFAAIAREMHKAVPQSGLRIIPGAGHAAHLEQPYLFNQAVMEFLARRYAGGVSHLSTTGSVEIIPAPPTKVGGFKLRTSVRSVPEQASPPLVGEDVNRASTTQAKSLPTP